MIACYMYSRWIIYTDKMLFVNMVVLTAQDPQIKSTYRKKFWMLRRYADI
jgi:hypothetical protein